MLRDSSSLASFVDPVELSYSRRLGITYEGVGEKFLIGNNFTQDLRRQVLSGQAALTPRLDSIDSAHSRLTLTCSDPPASQSYYFKNGRLISPIAYFTDKWPRRESRHFTFRVSDTTLFNEYSIAKLETFLDSAAAILGMPQDKILYVLCRNDDEIKNITGFSTLGMYVLSYDAVVTTFNCHYHELLHLLMNERLRRIPLFMHPFLQEGFAVALGGRGGREPGVMLAAGKYLAMAGFTYIPTLLSHEGFAGTDPSIAYPVAGLYNLFLLKTVDTDYYLKLCRRYSAGEDAISSLAINPADLPPDWDWGAFLGGNESANTVSLKHDTTGAREVLKAERGKVSETDSLWIFQIQDTLLLSGGHSPAGYSSKRFSELLPGRTYHGEKYLITASAAEINIYNLYSNNLIASLIASFSLSPLVIKPEGRFFTFAVKKYVFDEPLSSLKIGEQRNGTR
jgi:hypothetical protein